MVRLISVRALSGVGKDRVMVICVMLDMQS